MAESGRRDELLLVTGGAGFIGSNVVARYLSKGKAVRVYDNLSRAGTEENLKWLQSLGYPRLEVVRGDVRDYDTLRRAMESVDAVFHFASQVAVTSSVSDPRTDFEVNALGTFNMLESARECGRQPAILFSSTNKVYGGMEDAVVEMGDGGYRYRHLPAGVSEGCSLDFHSPYGCSKGAGDQYVRDYARIYGLRTVVFRQSCIYGPRQFGNEDQGWVAHFAISAAFRKPVTIFGDGYQVRDLLHVDDLIDAFDQALHRMDAVKGRVYNVGGGPANAVSLRWLVSELERAFGRKLDIDYGDWRPGDQRVYVSDIRKATEELDWAPRISAAEGIGQLLSWIRENPGLF